MYLLLWAVLVILSTTTTTNVVLAEDAELEFNYLPVAHVRTDPILSQTCLSDHVHTFYGPQLVRPEVTTNDLVRSYPAKHTGLVKENKSLYWHPTIYRYDPDTGLYTIDDIYYTSVYYFWDTTETTFTFPKGFRMIAKDVNAFTECTVGSFKACQRSNCYTENTFFPSRACDMLEITMDFPTCWDGRIDSPDHVSHVVYADDCPSTHPKRIPLVSISV